MALPQGWHVLHRLASLSGSVGCASDWRPGGRGFDPSRGRQHSFVEIDHEIFSTVILSLPLIQEGQLSVSGERMCTILVNRLEDKTCPVNVWLGKLTALDMTPLGWLGHKTSAQTNLQTYIGKKLKKSSCLKLQGLGLWYLVSSIWQGCSNYAPGVKRGPAHGGWGRWGHFFYIVQKAIGNDQA